MRTFDAYERPVSSATSRIMLKSTSASVCDVVTMRRDPDASAAAAGGPLTALQGGFGAVKNALSPVGQRLSSIAGKIKGIGKG